MPNFVSFISRVACFSYYPQLVAYQSPFNRLKASCCNVVRRYSSSEGNSSVQRLWGMNVDENELLVLQNGAIQKIAIQKFLEMFHPYKSIHFDLGTGDGKYVYREALKNKDIFYIGVDSQPNGMVHLSRKILRKPARGGTENVTFMVSQVENMPLKLRLVADTISVNYPWGKLHKGIVLPESDTLSCISNLGKANCRLDIRLNYTVLNDASYATRLELPHVTPEYIQKWLVPKYKEADIVIQNVTIGKSLTRTGTWGQHLTLGSNRQTMHLECKILHRETTPESNKPLL